MTSHHAAQAKTSQPAERTAKTPAPEKSTSQTHPMLHLQRQVGNQAATSVIQAKLTVGEPNDGDSYVSEKQSPNQTGLPDRLKANIENLSGYSMDDVRVHYNSSKPAQLHAYAYTQGTDIYVAPGQEKHLPHEAWHVVQQAQGCVKPMMQMKGLSINSDPELEREADAMGTKALQIESNFATYPKMRSLNSIFHSMGTIQMVRALIGKPPSPISLETLQGSVNDHFTEIEKLEKELEALNSHLEQSIDMEKIKHWKKQAEERLINLRNLKPGDATYDQEQINYATDGIPYAFRAVLISLANIRNTLNNSLNTRQEIEKVTKDASDAAEKSREEKLQLQDQKKQDENAAKLKQLDQKRGKRVPGLGNKWKSHNKQLKYNNVTVFGRYVPVDSSTIQTCLQSQKITDAVWEEDKAFWIADSNKYKLSSANGKAYFLFTFTSEGARSLMEDYLICGSGDYEEDNEEEYKGETSHPLYTIWKTNEIGAYGVGRERLKELEKYVEKIEAYGPKGNKIVLNNKLKKP